MPESAASKSLCQHLLARFYQKIVRLPSSAWLDLTVSVTTGPAPFKICTAFTWLTPWRLVPFTLMISSPSCSLDAEGEIVIEPHPTTVYSATAVWRSRKVKRTVPAAPLFSTSDTTIEIPCSHPPLKLNPNPFFFRSSLTILVPRRLSIPGEH